MPTKLEVIEELKRVTMQIEHFEAQHRNTFSAEEKTDCIKTLKVLWSKIDTLLDQLNFQKKFGTGLDNQ